MVSVQPLVVTPGFANEIRMCTQEAQNTHIATRIEISRTLVLEYKLLIRVLHSGRLIINSHDRHSVAQERRLVDDSLEFLESLGKSSSASLSEYPSKILLNCSKRK